VSAFVIAAGPGSASDIGIATSGSSDAALLLGASTLLLLVVSLHLWRERRRLREHLTATHRIADTVPPGLRVGQLAPGFSILGADGETITLDELRSRGKPVALIFGEPGCGPCSVLVPELQRWRQALAGDLTLGLVGIDTYLRYEAVAARNGTSIHETYERNPDLAAEADQLHAVFAAYRLRATPSAVLVTPEGTIASATVDGRPAIKALIRLAVNRRGAAGLRVHQPPRIRFGAIRDTLS
jgi:thiol-disulfide isomerase/thioredoxin